MVLSLEILKKNLKYSPDTGVFTWRKELTRNSYRGKPAGCIDSDTGYLVIRINNVLHYAHRLAWLYCHEEWPSEVIDHINHDRSDNRLQNLRVVNRQENSRNMVLNAKNTSGVTGVCFDRWAGRWKAYIAVDGRLLHLGRFDTKEEAITARNAANKKHGFHQNHGLAA